MRKRSPIIAIVFALLLSSCSGGGGSVSTSRFIPVPVPSVLVPPSVATPPPTSSSTTTILVVNIGQSADLTQQSRSRNSSSSGRGLKYISSSAMGVKVTAAGLTTQVFDVSSGSPLCTGSGASRSCSLPLIAAPGAYTFTLSIYDSAPVAGVIPGPANLLGASSLVQTINPNVANTLTFVVAGQVTTVSNASLYASLPSNGVPQTAGIAFIALDHGGNTISTGAYANPISISLAETGGSGHAYLKVNGVNVGASGTISNVSDIVSITYDGAASSGYSDTVTFSDGASNSVVRMSPLIVSGSASPTGAGNTANVAITEASAPVSVAYNQALTGCASVATVPAAGAGSGAAGVASVTDTVQPAGGKTCTLTISDNLGSSVSLPVTIPAGTPTCASAAVNTQITPTTVGNGTPCVPSAGYGVSVNFGGASGTISVTEAKDTSTLTQTNSCSGLATISPASQPGAGSPSGTASGSFSVTATSNTNSSCNVMIADGNGQTSTFPITIVGATYECSDQPNGTSLGSNYYSNGTRCPIISMFASGSYINLFVSGLNGYNYSFVEYEDTTPLNATLSGNCSSGGSYPLTSTSAFTSPNQRQNIQILGVATAANQGAFCTITVSDTAGQSNSLTIYFYP